MSQYPYRLHFEKLFHAGNTLEGLRVWDSVGLALYTDYMGYVAVYKVAARRNGWTLGEWHVEACLPE